MTNPSQESFRPGAWTIGTSEGTLRCREGSAGNTLWDSATYTWTCKNPGTLNVGVLVKVMVTDLARSVGADLTSHNVGSEIRVGGEPLPTARDNNGEYAFGKVQANGTVK